MSHTLFNKTEALRKQNSSIVTIVSTSSSMYVLLAICAAVVTNYANLSAKTILNLLKTARDWIINLC